MDEAVAELDKYLDDAYLSHLPSVRVVHGKGTGALRKGIHNYLRRQKHVADFHLAEFGEGDAGVTIVTFKNKTQENMGRNAYCMRFRPVPSEGESFMASKQKILIVDDDNNIAELISLYLTKECYDTKIVNDGEEAVRGVFTPSSRT